MALFGFGKKEESKKSQPTVETKPESSVKKELGNLVGNMVKRPVITEKAMGLEPAGQYIFEVTERATKTGVKKEIESVFNVKVARVNIINTKSKPVMFRGKLGHKSGLKKAMVKLNPGHKITVHQQTK